MSQIKAVRDRPMTFTKAEIEERDRARREALQVRPSNTYRSVSPQGKPPVDRWWERGACKDMDTDLFFSEGSISPKARRACASCSVRQECYVDTLEAERRTGLSMGYSGGTSATERQATLWAEARGDFDTRKEAARQLLASGWKIKSAAVEIGLDWRTVKALQTTI